ncbi:MAG TPA: hypothetical protein VIK41_23730 [Gemmatimonadaceae bacterium]
MRRVGRRALGTVGLEPDSRTRDPVTLADSAATSVVANASSSGRGLGAEENPLRWLHSLASMSPAR